MTHEEFIRQRGVRRPCFMCRGLGTRWYPSTSTWREGMGGASFTVDVCDKCWGSGDEDRPWLDLRENEKERRAWEAGQCRRWLQQRLGLNYRSLTGAWDALLKVLEKEGRRRKMPEGVCHPYDWHAVTTVLAKVIKELRETSEFSGA